MSPKIARTAFVAPSASIVGAVELAERTSVWYGSVIKAHRRLIRIGRFTNVQDDCTIEEADRDLNPDHDGSTIIGHYVTIGHRCFLKACTVENFALVGMGSTLCEGSYMEHHSMLAAGSVLPSNARVLSHQLWMGNPAKYRRDLTHEELDRIKKNAWQYGQLAITHIEHWGWGHVQYLATDADYNQD